MEGQTLPSFAKGISMFKPASIPARRNSAQGLVEFAIILPILLLLILGIIEFARMMFIYTAVSTASREASRYGSAVGNNPAGTPYFMDCPGIQNQAMRIGILVGVDPGDIYINYDKGPGVVTTPLACPVPATQVALGDRIVVEVRGEYNPVPAAPLVNVPVFEFSSISRRTIVKNAPVIQAGTAVSIFTPTLVLATPTQTETPAPTDTPTSGPTPTETGTPTPTPIPPVPPIYVSATATKFGNRCNDVQFTWRPAAYWATYPGESVANYVVSVNGVPAGTVAPNDPNPTTWDTNVNMNNNVVATFSVRAQFTGPLGSEILNKTYVCDNGTLVDLSSPVTIHVAIIDPTSGETITQHSDTAFEVEAWDPAVGTNNGDGIDWVQIQVIAPGGTLYSDVIEFIVGYCAFQGDSPCGFWDNIVVPNFNSAPEGVYTIRARAYTTAGLLTDWVSLNFTVDRP